MQHCIQRPCPAKAGHGVYARPLAVMKKKKNHNMKKILFLNMTIILLSGCCTFTSQDCGCNPPDPELLKEARDWIIPFDNKEYLIFENGNGNTDSLKIERVVDTEFIGGDECGTDSEVERAILQSSQNSNLKFTIEGTMKNYVAFNYLDDREQFIYAELNSGNNEVDIFNENTTGIIDNDFIWNGETISVLKISCENSSNCSNYEMSKFTISKDLGLLEYNDKSGINWKRTN